MALEIRPAHMYTDIVGTYGVSSEELNELAPRLTDIHQDLMRDATQGLHGQYGA